MVVGEYIEGGPSHQDVTMYRVVLASTSSSRRTLLQSAGLAPRCEDPAIDESLFQAPDPSVRALAIANAKAAAVPVGVGEIGIAADQVAFDPSSGRCFGKPIDDADQFERLCGLRGRTHTLHTAWVVYDQQRVLSGVEVSRITIAAVTEEEVRAYVATGEARRCAGGYAVEGLGSFLIAELEGDWSGVLGLPLYAVHRALRELGWRFPTPGRRMPS